MTRPSQPEIPFADKPVSASETTRMPVERNWLTLLAGTPRPKPKPDYRRVIRRSRSSP